MSRPKIAPFVFPSKVGKKVAKNLLSSQMPSLPARSRFGKGRSA